MDENCRAVNKHFDLSVSGIIESLDLKRPIYRNTASYGHFGRNHPDFSWEKTDKVQQLQEALNGCTHAS